MIPSSKWFPTSLAERSAWYANLATQFDDVAISLGFTAADVTAVNDDHALLQSITAITMELDSYAAAVRQYRKIVTEGNTGDPTPAFPAMPTYVIAAAVPTGLFERLDSLVKRIRVAPNYTNEIGALLGIMPSNPSPVPPVDMQPTLKTVSMPGSIVLVSFVRGETDGIVVETKLDNADVWTDAGRFFKSPAELVIPQNAQSLPRSVQVRARYVEGNTPVGQLSPVVTTATQPEG